MEREGREMREWEGKNGWVGGGGDTTENLTQSAYVVGFQTTGYFSIPNTHSNVLCCLNQVCGQSNTCYIAASIYHLLVKLSQLQSPSLLPWQLQLLQASSRSLEERGRGVKYCCTVGVHAARLRTVRIHVRRTRDTLKCIQAMDVQ